MGVLNNNTMRIALIGAAILLVVSLAASAAETPYDDETLVPEETMNEEIDSEHAHNVEFAVQTSHQLADDSKCKKLAEDMKKEVDVSTSTDQKALDLLADAKCDKEGTGLVANTKSQLAVRMKELAAATKAKLAAHEVSVQFQGIRFADINEAACSSQFFQQTTYTTATKHVFTTTTYESKKKGEVGAAKVALKDAEAEASRLQAACRCRMKKAAIKAFDTLSKNNDMRREAYGRANMLLCVLAKKSLSDKSCTPADVPKLRMPKGVHEDICMKYVQLKVATKCSTKCGQAKKTFTGPIKCEGIRGNAEPESKCKNIKLVEPAPDTRSCLATGPCATWKVVTSTTKCPATKCWESNVQKCGSLRCQTDAGATVSDSHCAGQPKPQIACIRCRSTAACLKKEKDYKTERADKKEKDTKEKDKKEKDTKESAAKAKEKETKAERAVKTVNVKQKQVEEVRVNIVTENRFKVSAEKGQKAKEKGDKWTITARCTVVVNNWCCDTSTQTPWCSSSRGNCQGACRGRYVYKGGGGGGGNIVVNGWYCDSPSPSRWCSSARANCQACRGTYVQTGSKHCALRGDPHVTNFAGQKFNHYKSGTFTVFNNGKVQVQAEQDWTKTWGSHTAIQGIIVKYGGGTYQVSVNQQTCAQTGNLPNDKNFGGLTVNYKKVCNGRVGDRLFDLVLYWKGALTGVAGLCTNPNHQPDLTYQHAINIAKRRCGGGWQRSLNSAIQRCGGKHHLGCLMDTFRRASGCTRL